ncbi:uncharacterized protein LOC131949128 isoform X2 [Physella acuta]|nr:uncharacterized protein LOC131949128 isoform X2 [Physella acuta]
MHWFRLLTGCEDKIQMTKVKWHAPLLCVNESLGLYIKYFPHKHPFYGAPREYISNTDVHSSLQLMDNIPKEGKYVVHIHEYLHIVSFHMSVVENHLLLVRDAIKRLVERNPTAYVIYQTVHAAFDNGCPVKQRMNAFMLELQRRVLRGVSDRVMLAVTWPMTVASANKLCHPTVSDQFLKFYMGHICGRF